MVATDNLRCIGCDVMLRSSKSDIERRELLSPVSRDGASCLCSSDFREISGGEGRNRVMRGRLLVPYAPRDESLPGVPVAAHCSI